VPGQAGDRSEEVLRGEVLALVESWAAAWSERRVDDYLSFYSGDFQPPSGASRAEWEQSRRERVGRPEEIEVTVALMDIRIEGATRAEVDLIQSYDSSAYSDTVLKTLTLGRERDRWRIVRETLVEE
jgi:ketosteroid isomerase-like protein